MKINWGAKMALFSILFMGFVIIMVLRISQTDMPLVEESYYEKGINYQQIIDDSKNSESRINILIGKLQGYTGIDTISEYLFLNKYSIGDTLTVNAFFYRASDKSKDFSVNFVLIDSIPTGINVSNIDKGKWKLTLGWDEKDGKHLLKKEIVL